MMWGGPSAWQLPLESPANSSPHAAKRQPFLADPLRAVSKFRLPTLSIYHLCFMGHYHFTCVSIFLFSVLRQAVFCVKRPSFIFYYIFCFLFYSFLLSYIFPFYGDHFFTNVHTIGIFKVLGFRYFCPYHFVYLCLFCSFPNLLSLMFEPHVIK